MVASEFSVATWALLADVRDPQQPIAAAASPGAVAPALPHALGSAPIRR